MFAKISRLTPEEEVCTNWARRGGFYTTKDMRPIPKRHTPTPKNRCAGTTLAMHTDKEVCMLTSKGTCTYTKKYMHLHKGVHELIQKCTCTYIKKYIHLYERNTCTYTKKYMRLAKKW